MKVKGILYIIISLCAILMACDMIRDRAMYAGPIGVCFGYSILFAALILIANGVGCIIESKNRSKSEHTQTNLPTTTNK
ncbi:MAG: hypothetical protein IKW83_07365 [Muribaculaceae bacterium]|nr:hypothetical protein [Muribaculaceae bacterium]